MNRARRLLLVAGLLAAFCGPASPARAVDLDADIPGTLWNGGIARSSVGGTLYDRVWRIELPEGRVALLRLFGAKGAELGLYLFDASAASIRTATPLYQSAQQGGNQRITAVLTAGTYYVNVNGRNQNRAYDFSLSISLLQDPTPPIVMTEIEGGTTRIATTTPIVTVTATDTLSGVDAVRLRVNEGAWGDWESPAAEHLVQLPASEGRHRVEAQARNGAGLVSAATSDEVFLDLTAPTATLLRPAENTFVNRAQPTIEYRFSEAMDAQAWSRGGLTLISLDGETLSGRGSYDTPTKIGRFTTAPLAPGIEYIVQPSEAYDLAGNRVSLMPWTVTYLVPTRITTPQRTIRVSGDAPAQLSFRATDVPTGAQLVVERLESTEVGVSRWVPVQTTTAVGSGTLQRVIFQPTQSARYAVRFPGSTTHATSRTPSVQVILTPRLELSGQSGIIDVSAGSVAQATFSVAPSELASVTLVRYRCTSGFRRCEAVERTAVTPLNGGSIVASAVLPVGNWAWRIRVSDSDESEFAVSPLARISVR